MNHAACWVCTLGLALLSACSSESVPTSAAMRPVADSHAAIEADEGERTKAEMTGGRMVSGRPRLLPQSMLVRVRSE
jgi:hypothetical protein